MPGISSEAEGVRLKNIPLDPRARPTGSDRNPSPRVRVASGIEITYRVDEFCDGWSPPETVMMLHGIAETGDASKGWIPHLRK